jgi:hypothetical protein
MNIRQVSIAAAVLLIAAQTAAAVEHVSLTRDGKPLHVSGKIVTEAQNGGLLLLAPDGVLWAVQPEEIVTRRSDDEAFLPLGQKEMAAKLLAEMPAGFKIHTTANYVICYNTSPAYAQWCGALYERLFRAFQNYWTQRGFKLRDPEMPLVALVFDDKQSYINFSRPQFGAAAESIIGYYDYQANRVVMYDLTGVEGLRPAGERISTATRVNQILSQPSAAATVATIVHEATHQLAFNCGLQTRGADNPVWVSEGIAVYFETPDMSNSKGWGSIGSLNRPRLNQFQNYLQSRPANSLDSLLRDDLRFREAKSGLNAYAEAWALNYFLLRTRSKEYVAYLQVLSQKQPSVFDEPEERLALFKSYFGPDLQKFDAEFVDYIRRLR